jgi:hypothetical protein
MGFETCTCCVTLIVSINLVVGVLPWPGKDVEREKFLEAVLATSEGYVCLLSINS